MTIQFTLSSRDHQVLTLVKEFAQGLGCSPAAGSASAQQAIHLQLPEGSDALMHLLVHVALAATKAGIDLGEPMCRIRYWEPHAAARVTLDLRLADFRLDAASQGDEPRA
jgi:hypothetical protein